MFDNCDGKQARRTNNASPLGQLFDHGSDCLFACLPCSSISFSLLNRSGICVVFASAFTLATLGITEPWKQLLYLCVFQFGFFLPTYEGLFSASLHRLTLCFFLVVFFLLPLPRPCRVCSYYSRISVPRTLVLWPGITQDVSTWRC